MRDIALPGKNFYFSGIADDIIFLSHKSSPNRVLEVDTIFTKTISYSLLFGETKNLYAPEMSVTATRNVFIMDGLMPAIMHGHLSDSSLMTVSLDKLYFQKGLALSDASLMLQVFDSTRRQNVFIKYNLLTKHTSRYIYAPTTYGDGVFSIDGTISFDEKAHQLAYVYFFRNRFDILDTNLHVIGTSQTIDTVSHPVLSINTFGNKRTLTSTPLLVNKGCCISGNRLYIISGITAKNELKDLRENCTVIDIYSVITGAYIQSLYAYDFRDQPLSDFKVIGDQFIGIFGNYLAKFAIKRVRSDKD